MKVSFDYDGTISTARGRALAMRRINSGDTVYIISARSSKDGMMTTAEQVGIPSNQVYATGSNTAKVQKVKDLGIDTHYDNNTDVIRQLPGIGHKF